MDWQIAGQIYRSYFHLQDLRSLEYKVSFPFVRGDAALNYRLASQFTAELNRLGSEAGLDDAILREVVATRISDLRNLKTIDSNTSKAAAAARKRQRGRVGNPFRDLVTEEIRKLGQKIAAIPSSIER